MFPVSVSGSISNYHVRRDKEVIKQSILNDLAEQSIEGIRTEDGVSFRNWKLVQWSTNRYIGVNFGTFVVETEPVVIVKYKLSLLRLIMTVCIVMIPMSIAISLAENLSTAEKVQMVGAFSAFLFLPNYFLVKIRTIIAIRKILSRIREKT